MILDIELDGARQVRGLFPDALLIWVNPPSFSELERRLIERDDTEPAAVQSRLERAREDIALAPSLFNKVLVNDDVDRVARQIHELISSHFHCRYFFILTFFYNYCQLIIFNFFEQRFVCFSWD